MKTPQLPPPLPPEAYRRQPEPRLTISFGSVQIGSAPAPPIPVSEVDTERTAKLDAERVTLEFASRSTRRLDTGTQPIEHAPLFGGDPQGELF